MKPHNSRYYYYPTATLYLPSVAKYWAVKWIIEAYQYLNNNTREDVDNFVTIINVILKNETSNLILVILLHNRGCSTHPLAIGTTIICSKWCIALLPALFCVNLATEKVRLLINNSCWRPVLKVEIFFNPHCQNLNPYSQTLNPNSSSKATIFMRKLSKNSKYRKRVNYWHF